MSSHTRSNLTVGEQIRLVCLVPRLAYTIAAFAVTSCWLQWLDGKLCARQLRRILTGSSGTVISVLSPRQVRTFMSHTTGEVVEEYAAVHGISHQSVLVENNDGFQSAKLHFIGCKLKQKSPIMLYFHGGGFIVPLASPEFPIWAARTAGASPVILEYTLAPECVYPGQLSQAIAALRLILQYRDPSDIIIAGESAGGNIALATMAHLQQPKIGIEPLDLSSTPAHAARFRGLLAISPRTANEPKAESFRPVGMDWMNKNSLGAITASWKPKTEVWAAPVLAKPGFWDGLKADRVLLATGGNEVYRDDISHVAKTMGAHKVDISEMEVKGEVEKGHDPRLQLIVCPGEMHCQASMDLSLGITSGSMTQGVGEWLSRFKGKGL